MWLEFERSEISRTDLRGGDEGTSLRVNHQGQTGTESIVTSQCGKPSQTPDKMLVCGEGHTGGFSHIPAALRMENLYLASYPIMLLLVCVMTASKLLQCSSKTNLVS